MRGTYIARYERKLIEDAVKAAEEAAKEANRNIALRMKADGVSSDFIFKYFGMWV